jgi:hypothetical protein
LDLWWSIAPGSPGRSARITLSDPESGAVAVDWSVPLPDVDAGDAAGAAGGTTTDTGAAAGPGGAAIIHQRLAVPVLARSGAGRYGLGVTLEDAEGRPLGPAATDLGIVEVAARDLSQLLLTPPLVDRTLDFTVGEIAELIGVDAPAAAAPGEPLDVALVWRALAPSRSAYKVTVQLLDESGRPVAQHDSEPAAGTRPTTGWVPEEIIVDRHSLTLPEDLAPGRYRLVAAVYHPVTGARLSVVGTARAGGDAAGDVIPLGEVELR